MNNSSFYFDIFYPFQDRVLKAFDQVDTSFYLTGGSAVATADILKRWGVKKIKFVGLIGAPEGIAAMQKAHPDIPIHLAAIDDHLNEHGYIVPGLGDAGDRQFGTG